METQPVPGCTADVIVINQALLDAVGNTKRLEILGAFVSYIANKQVMHTVITTLPSYRRYHADRV